jgi:PAS domain S-box-containing protein
MFAAIIILRLLIDDSQQAVTLLFAVPIALVAVELGVAWGIVAGGLALGLFAVWTATLAQGASYEVSGYLARGAVFLVLGGTVGALADRARKSTAESARFWELSTDLLCTAGFDGYFKRLSPAWERTLGWTPAELRARPYLEFVHPEDRERTVAEAERQTDRGEETLSFENRYLCKDGSYRTLLWSSKASAREELMYAVAKDVTARAEAERRVRRSEGFLDSVLENIPDMVFVKDAEDLRFLRLNRAGEELLGYSREEMIGKNDHDFFPAEEADFFTRKDREVLDSREVVDIAEEQIETKEKGPRTLHTRKIAVRDEHGEPRYLLGISEDVTERKLAEQRFRSLLEAAPDAMVVADEQGTIVLVNTQTEKLLGYESEELIGEPVELLVPNNLRGRHSKHRDSFLSDPKSRAMGSDLSLFARRKDGSEVPVEISLGPVQTEVGTQVIAAIRDISARKRIEEQAEVAREEAEFANRAKNEFLSRMSHELRTPLNAVIGFAQLLELEDLGFSQREGVEEILKGGRHLLELINEVLDISRIESGTMSISIEPVHLGSVLADALSLIRPLAEEAKVKLDIDSSDMESVYVLADQQRLKQVLINLLSNAVKYNREGGSVTVHCETRDAERIRFSVVDTGHGMDADQLKVLFSPFERRADGGRGHRARPGAIPAPS